jgi:hypothetical protein
MAWSTWGLMIVIGVPNIVEATRCHDLVASYLASHPRVAARYRSDQNGKVRYTDVLKMAEAEL